MKLRILILVTASFLSLPSLGRATETNSDAKPMVANQRYKVAVVDLMILKRQKLGAFQLAKDIGAEGVEVDMGGLGERETFDNQLTNAATRQQFLDKAKDLGLEIPSLAMTGFFAQSFAERPTVPRMIQDCVDTMTAMNVKIAFLPLGVKGDLVKNPELRTAIVERLKMAGMIAAKAGVVIGVETSLSAAEEVKLLDEVGSSAIKIYFNFANAAKNGRNIAAELLTLGSDRICQIHASNEDGVWLENDPEIDLRRVKQTLDGMGWAGWLVIERSRDAKDPQNVQKNFGANAAYLKKVFQNEGIQERQKVGPDDIIPLIKFERTPLSAAIENVAQYASINVMVDPHVTWPIYEKQKNDNHELWVTERWEDLSARQALEKLISPHNLKMINDSATTVVRIVNQNQRKRRTSSLSLFEVSTNEVIPLIQMEEVPIGIALENLGRVAGLRVIVDKRVDDSGKNPLVRRLVTIRWEEMTGIQALAALVDSYDLSVDKLGVPPRYEISVRSSR